MTDSRKKANPDFHQPLQEMRLSNFASEITQRVLSFIPEKSHLRLFALTSRFAASETHSLRLLPHVLRQVAHGDPALINQKIRRPVEWLFNLYSDMLFVKGHTSDPAGNLIYGSPWQIAWGAGDIWLVKMMFDLIQQIPNGIEIAIKQYAEQFPGGNRLDDRNIAQLAQLDADLDAVAYAVSIDPCTNGIATRQETINAVQQLQNHLAPKMNFVIKTGMYSPPEILGKILHVYRHKQWSSDRRTLFSCEVIGAALKIAAGVDAQMYKRGLSNYKDYETTIPDRKISYFFGGLHHDFGKDCSFDVYNGISVTGPRYGARGSCNTKGYDEINKFCLAKESALDELKYKLQQMSQQDTETLSSVLPGGY